MRRLVFVLLLPLLLSACGEERATPAEYLQIVPQIVGFMDQDARENAYGEGARGPLIVNVPSFQSGAYRATGAQLSEQQIERAIGRELVNLPDTAAILCEDNDVAPGCWVREYGVLLRMRVVRTSPGRIRAFVNSTVSDQRFIPSVICDRTWELVFRKEGERWVPADRTLTHACADA